MDHTKSDRGSRAMISALKELYAVGQSDYSFEPVVIEDRSGKPVGCINDGDAVIFCCRRGEREIQLTEAFTDPALENLTSAGFKSLIFVILTLYHDKFKDLPVAFAPEKVKQTLGEVVSRAGLRQLRVSESEKYAHVTFFLNGGQNNPFEGEVDVHVPSLKGIPFDQAPELSLAQVSARVMEGISSKYDLIITNFANGDVIGHTSNTAAKIKCAEWVDLHLKTVVEAATNAGYVVLITADHGNLEELFNEDHTPHISHTSNPVPLILIDPNCRDNIQLQDGSLADIAPTLLQILDIPKPELMDGCSLVPDFKSLKRNRAILIILDGWGIGKDLDSNPIAMASTPTWDTLLQKYPHSQLQASGDAVGLKPGKAGNSEAGHMNIGAGRVVLQDDVRLSQAMKDGSFYSNKVILKTLNEVKERGSKLHLIGLLTEKSSHGSVDYPLAVLKMAKEIGLTDVFLHMIFDGRSTEPGSAPLLLEKLEGLINEIGIGQIASGMGRGVALDRDHNYHKTQQAYNALVFGTGKRAKV